MKKTLFLVVTLFLLNASNIFAQYADNHEVGLPSTADSLQDSSLTYGTSTSAYIPPPPGNINSVFMTANGYIFLEYFYWEFFATMLSDYDKRPSVSFLGTDNTYKRGGMKLAEYEGVIGFLYDPTDHPENVQRRYSAEAIFPICFLLSEKQKEWLPGYGVRIHKIKASEVADNGMNSSNFILSPQEKDESNFKKVDKDDLEDYLKKRAK